MSWTVLLRHATEFMSELCTHLVCVEVGRSSNCNMLDFTSKCFQQGMALTRSHPRVEYPSRCDLLCVSQCVCMLLELYIRFDVLFDLCMRSARQGDHLPTPCNPLGIWCPPHVLCCGDRPTLSSTHTPAQIMHNQLSKRLEFTPASVKSQFVETWNFIWNF